MKKNFATLKEAQLQMGNLPLRYTSKHRIFEIKERKLPDGSSFFQIFAGIGSKSELLKFTEKEKINY